MCMLLLSLLPLSSFLCLHLNNAVVQPTERKQCRALLWSENPSKKLHSRQITKRVSAVMGKPQKAVSSSLLWQGWKKFAEFYKAFPNIWTLEIEEGLHEQESSKHFSPAKTESREEQRNVKLGKKETKHHSHPPNNPLLVINSQLPGRWGLRATLHCLETCSPVKFSCQCSMSQSKFLHCTSVYICTWGWVETKEIHEKVSVVAFKRWWMK